LPSRCRSVLEGSVAHVGDAEPEHESDRGNTGSEARRHPPRALTLGARTAAARVRLIDHRAQPRIGRCGTREQRADSLGPPPRLAIRVAPEPRGERLALLRRAVRGLEPRMPT